MNIKEIPRVLFQEFSQKLGQGEERKVSTRGYNYLLKELNSEVAGFPGAIGFRESIHGPSFGFVLWGDIPHGKDDVFEPEPRLTITAGPEDAGEWAYGHGNRMIEVCRAKFSLHGLILGFPVSQLIPTILQRASELATTAESEKYWEKERDPNRDYSKPWRY